METNITSAPIESAKKHHGTSHGLTMLALCLIDRSHSNLNVTITYDDSFSMENSAEQILAAWLKCESNKTRIVSYKINGEYQKNYLGLDLIEDSKPPVSNAEYKNYKAMIYADVYDNKQTYTIYYIGSHQPRYLILQVKSENML